MTVLSIFAREPIDQKTGKALLETCFEEESLIGKDLERNNRIEGSLGSAKLSENKRAEENAKAERKSKKKELVGWETKK